VFCRLSFVISFQGPIATSTNVNVSCIQSSIHVEEDTVTSNPILSIRLLRIHCLSFFDLRILIAPIDIFKRFILKFDINLPIQNILNILYQKQTGIQSSIHVEEDTVTSNPILSIRLLRILGCIQIAIGAMCILISCIGIVLDAIDILVE
jgi:hypothetical protein